MIESSKFHDLCHRLQELQIQLATTRSDSKSRSPCAPMPQSSDSVMKGCNKKEIKKKGVDNDGGVSKHNNKRKKLFYTCINANNARHPDIYSMNKENYRETISGLLHRLKEQERKYTTEKAALQYQAQQERERSQKAEAAARRAEDQRDYRIGEVKHLKSALQRRDDVITSLQDQLRDLEVGVACAEAVQQVQREKDEIKEVLIGVQDQLDIMTRRAECAQTSVVRLKEKLRSAQREKDTSDARYDTCRVDISRLTVELEEARNARASLEKVLNRCAGQTAHRKAQIQHLLALAEGDNEESLIEPCICQRETHHVY